MSDVTVKQLADVVGIPVERLIAQLGDAGLPAKDEDGTISDTEKVKLLSYLRRSHGKGDMPIDSEVVEPKKVTLKRRSISELRQSGSGPRKTTKTVNVEVRRKRTYVKRSVVQAEEEKRREEKEKAEETEQTSSQCRAA